MDIDRAQSIFESHGVIDVDYKGQPVWIRRVDKANDTVEIGIINSAQSRVVKAQELNED